MANEVFRRTDLRYTESFCNQYARAVVQKLKNRAPVDTGSLRADITYKLTFYNQIFSVNFYIDDHLIPEDSNLLPSEYGYLLDTNTRYHYAGTNTKTKGWFTNDVPGFSDSEFQRRYEEAYRKDMDLYIAKVVRQEKAKGKVKPR